MVMLFRPVNADDLPALFALAKTAGTGLTNLPADEAFLKQRIERSLKSFVEPEESAFYFFVLEHQGELIGTSAIETNVGSNPPFYSFKLSQVPHVSQALKVNKSVETLTLVNDYQHVTELCALYLNKHFRGEMRGVCLSKARYLFMAAFIDRFNDTVIADLRGVSDEKGESPFWHAVGEHFFDMDFAHADALTTRSDKQFIIDLMPKHPIYVPLLSEAAKAVIGKPHPNTKPAQAMLEQEGFKCNGYVDVFDAGPTLETPLTAIHSIQTASTGTVANITPTLASSDYLVANDRLAFCATICSLICDDNQQVTLSETAAKALQVKIGDTVRFVSLPASPKRDSL